MNEEPVSSGNLERVFLLPGELYVTKQPKFIATLLGSCVAVCVYNVKNGSAAMNHFVHDVAKEDKSNSSLSSGRFGDLSTTYIIESLLTLDANTKNYQAKIFGGGSVVSHLGVGMGIGKNNIEIAEKILDKFKIPIVERQTGGRQGIKIYFDTSDFSVKVRLIGSEKKDFSKQNIRVLVVDDSALVRQLLCELIEKTPGMEVAGVAKDAFEARDLMISENPDVVSLDIIMPGLNGLKFLEKLMKHFPKPVVIVSTIAKKDSDIANKAIKYGAVGVIDKESLNLYKSQSPAENVYTGMLKAASARVVTKKF